MSVWKYVKVDGAWRYKAAIEDKGKIIPNMVRVDGKVEFHEEGTYYFRSGRQWIKLDAMPASRQEARERLRLIASNTWSGRRFQFHWRALQITASKHIGPRPTVSRGGEVSSSSLRLFRPL